MVNSETIDDIVERLKVRIDEHTKDPDQPWKDIKDSAMKAKESYLKVHKGGKEIKASDYDLEFNKRAETYLKSVFGASVNAPEHYGQTMLQMFESMGHEGRQLKLEMEAAIKRGDELSAVQAMQTAYQTHIQAAKQRGLLNEIRGIEDPGKRGKVYEHLGRQVASLRPDEKVDPLAIGENPAQYLGLVRRNRITARDILYHPNPERN